MDGLSEMLVIEKRLRPFLVCFFLIFGIICPSAKGDPRFKIGAILAMSGDFSIYGNACQNGMEMAYDELLPSLKDKVQIVYEDDSCQPAKAANAFHKLLSSNKVNAIVSLTSSPSNAVAPLAQESGLPMIAIASDPEIAKNRSLAFLLWITPEDEAKALLPEIRRRGYKRIARIIPVHSGASSTVKAMDNLNNGDYEVVLHEEYSSDAKDFRPFITKLKAIKNVDSVMSLLLPGSNGILAKQLRQLGLKQPLFNIETFENPEDVKMAEGAMLGAWFVAPGQGNESFARQYKKRFPEAASYFSANCHDAVALLAASIEKGIPPQEYLNSVKSFHGALGTFSATGDKRFSLPATIKVITENGYETLR